MAKTLTIISAVGFCLLLIGTGCTKEASTSAADNATAASGKFKRFTGEITDIDSASNTITVKRTKDEGRFDVSSLGNAKAIKIGKKVTVSYYEQDGSKIAKSVKPAKTKRTKKKKEESP